MSALKSISNKFNKFGKSLVGNRVFDLYLKYNGIKLLTSATLVPIALIMGRDQFEKFLNKSMTGGGESNLPVIDDPLIGPYLKLSGVTTLGSISPNTLVPIGVLMLLYNVYNTGSLVGGGDSQVGGVELMSYVKNIWDNRVLDLFVKYQGIKLLTTSTLVPLALLFGKDMLEASLKSGQTGGQILPDDVPFLDDPLLGNYLKLSGLTMLDLSTSTLIPLGLAILIYHTYLE